MKPRIAGDGELHAALDGEEVDEPGAERERRREHRDEEQRQPPDDRAADGDGKEAASLQLHLELAVAGEQGERRDPHHGRDDEADPPVDVRVGEDAAGAEAERDPALKAAAEQADALDAADLAPEDGADRRDHPEAEAGDDAADRERPEPGRHREDQAADADEDAAQPQAWTTPTRSASFGPAAIPAIVPR